MPARTLPPDARRSLFVYNLFFPLALLIMLPAYLARMFRRGGFRNRFGQRFARYSGADLERFRSRKWIWIHSISVGETFVALKLAHAIHERRPEIGILLSTTTSTGFAEASKAASDWLEPIYNLVDFAPVVRSALDALQPEQLVVIEGGLWPNLIAECYRRSIPMTLASARLSPRSERRFRKFRNWTGPIYRLLDRICVTEPEDITRWESLGAERAHTVCTGSIKFDNPAISTSREAEFRDLLAGIGFTPNAPVIVGGSTWAPEEFTLAKALPVLRQQHPECRLVLVPRHVERTPEILRELAPLNLRIARRTQLFTSSPAEPVDILIVDTTGELRDWYGVATVVFIGKSLPGIAAVGGQNPAEPAVLGKPVVYGPHMENFLALTTHLKQQDAALQVADAEELNQTLQSLLGDATRRTVLGNHARTAIATHAGATSRTAELIFSL